MKKDEKKKKRPLWKRILRFLLKTLAVILVLFIILVLAVRSEWGQNLIVNKVVNYVSEKTNTKVEIEKLFITFYGDVQLDGLYLEDKNRDTLVYSKSLEAGIPLWPIIKGNPIGIDDVEWEGLRANIIRKDSINGFNYQFLVDAFAPADTTAIATDEDAKPLKISVGTVNLKDFNIKFIDDVSGIDSRVQLGEFDLAMDEFDLEQMRYEIDDIGLKDTSVKFIQTKSTPETEDVNESPKPFISIGNLSLDNVSAKFESIPNNILADVFIGEFQLELPEANLAENKIDVSSLQLSKSNILLKMEDTVEDADKISEPTTAEPFEWPAWLVNVDELNFQDNTISYFKNKGVSKKGQFNPDAIAITDFNLNAETLQLKDQSATANIKQFQFKEASGINLKEVQLNLNANDTETRISDINIKLNNNSLSGQLKLNYNSLASAIENPENASLNLDFPNIKADVSDAFLFQPDLKQNEYVRTLSKQRLNGNLRLYGLLSDLNIPKAQFNWRDTNITLNGRIQNVMDTDKLQLDIPSYSATSTKTDLNRFVVEDSMGVSIPKNITLAGSIKGGLKNITTDSKLTTTDGNVLVKGNFKNAEDIAFDTLLETDSLQLGKILKNEQLSVLNLKVEAKGSGSTVNTIDADVKATLKDFTYSNYTYETINLQGQLVDGFGPINLDYKDDNLNMTLKSLVTLDSVSPQIDATLDLIGANLQKLGFTRKNIKTAFQLNMNFEGNAETFDASANIVDGVSIYDNQTYLLGNLTAAAFVRPDTTYVKLKNKMVDLELESNANPTQTSKAITEHINSYLTKQAMPDSLQNVQLKLHGKITDSPILKEVFLTDLKQLDTVNINVDFSAQRRELIADIKAPYINYGDNELDSLAFNLNSTQDSLTFDFGLRSLTAGPVAIKRTLFDGQVSNDSLLLNFTSYNETEKLISIKSELFRKNDSISFHINPSELILNANDWQIPQNNNITIAEKRLDITDFILSRNDQSLIVTNKKPDISKDHLAVDFENFKLSSILSYFNPDETLAKGQLNGSFVVEEPYGNTGFLADLGINDFKVLDVDLGKLSLDANSEGDQNYNLDILVNGGDVDLQLVGTYQAQETSANLDLTLDINKFKMSALEGFLPEQFKNTSGSFAGNIAVSGTTTDPKYDGVINFNDAKFNVAQLNAGFNLENETLKLDNSGLYFSDFSIADENGNTFTVDGNVGTEELTNPVFDLNFKANDFRVLNSTADDNNLYYGTAVFDLDATLKGDLVLPILRMTLDVGSETNVTYVLPPSQVAVESRDGIVLFVDKDNPDSILNQTEENEEGAIVTGFDIKSTINVGKDAVVNVIVDEQTGDNLRVQGEGELKFDIYPNGRTTLTGRYTMSDGHYELSLYNLVKRRFEISPGSTITWAGDPFDATLDASAIYRVETSASALMASSTSGASISEKQRFRQKLPFLVYLNVDGELTEPKLSFNVELPEDEKGAIGGQVYGRLQQLNQQENQLNKQVFSLLVLNRFYPDSGSDGSSGGTASIARDNINQALSDQLNVFADKLLGDTGVELDFGLDSYTDYQGNSPQERTTLDVAAQKKFLNDRLVVRVGSEVDVQGSGSNPDGSTTPLVGNVSLEYLLTEDGKYRLKGFRKNQFENVIDGQLIVSGIAFIFTQEFNKFEELWRNFLKNETSKTNETEAEIEDEKKEGN